MPQIYETTSIWLGATFLTEAGAKLVDVQISRNGRETIVFSFMGETLSQIAQAYCKGQIEANVVQLREKLNELRDLILQKRSN